VATVRIPFTVEKNYAGWRLDEYLQQKIRRLSPGRIQELIETARVLGAEASRRPVTKQ